MSTRNYRITDTNVYRLSTHKIVASRIMDSELIVDSGASDQINVSQSVEVNAPFKSIFKPKIGDSCGVG